MAAMHLDEQQIFDVVRKIEAGTAREAYLQQVCGDDAALGQRVRALLQAYEAGASFLEPPVLAATIAPPEGRGMQIGPYKLMEQIGEGGMGLVFVAEQHEPVRRKVALKLIKPGMDSREIIARFEAERQALALMDHPNIARVLDAGATSSGRPYFVMELVKGMPITQYCDDNRLTPRERLELFTHVCHAVQHAHQKGIIHRDIKPTNVLVTSHDGRPVVKVIDFGVAKAVGQQLTEKTLYTNLAQMVGTPLYMSPEQAGMSGLDIDTRTDIYSLGVLLYELLTGTTPFDKERLKQAAYDEMRRIIREEEPPKPSTRISTTDAAPSIAACRHTEPSKLVRLVRGDLDWIVMKALEKDRARRYETANGFALDVQRYLADEPVLACPPSAAYRFRKFARRSKGALLTASLLITALIVLVAGLAISNVRVIAERNEKSQALNEKSQALKDREKALADARASALLAEAESKRTRKNFLAARVAIREVMTKAALGADEWSQLPPALRKKFSDEALKFYQGVFQESPDPGDRYETAIAHRSVGLLYARGADPDLEQAEHHYRTSIDMLEELAAQHPEVAEYRHELGWAHYEWGVSLAKEKRFAEAEASFRRCATLYLALVAEAPESTEYPAILASCFVAWRTRTPSGQKEIEKLLQERIDLQEHTVSGQQHSIEDLEKLAQCCLQAGGFHISTQQYEKAEEAYRLAARCYEQVVAAKPDSLAIRLLLTQSYFGIHEVLFFQANQIESTAIARRVIDLYENALREFPEQRQKMLQKQGHNYRYLGYRLWNLKDYAAAREAFEASSEVFRQCAENTYTRERASCFHGRAANSLLIAGLWEAEGRSEEAQKSYQEALARYELLLTEELSQHITPGWVNGYPGQLAQVLEKIGTPEDALRISAKLRPPGPELNAEGVRGLSSCYVQIARILHRAGQHTEAVAALGQAQERLRHYIRSVSDRVDSQSAANRLQVVHAQRELRLVLEELGLRQEAQQALREASDLLESLAKAVNVAEALRLEIGHMLWAVGDAWLQRQQYQDAERVYRQAVAMFERLATNLARPQFRQQQVVSYTKLAALMHSSGQAQDALSCYQQVLELDEKLPPEIRDSAGYRNDLASALAYLGLALEKAQRPVEAEEAHRKALALRQQLSDEDPSNEWHRQERAHFSLNLGILLQAAERPEEGLEHCHTSVRLNEQLVADFADKPAHKSRLAHARGVFISLLSSLRRDEELGKEIEALLKGTPSADELNSIAWALCSRSKPSAGSARLAVDFAEKAVGLNPNAGHIRNTLGVAHYRAGNWPAAIEALQKARELHEDKHFSWDAFFLAIAHWQTGNKDEARQWFDQAVEWMDKNQPQNEELRRFRAEAEKLLGENS